MISSKLPNKALSCIHNHNQLCRNPDTSIKNANHLHLLSLEMTLTSWDEDIDEEECSGSIVQSTLLNKFPKHLNSHLHIRPLCTDKFSNTFL